MNQAKLIGNLGADPVIKPMAKGQDAAFFSMATTERWKDKESGEQRENVQWHQIAVFEPKLVAFAKEHLRKGSFVQVEGRIVNSTWTDGEGRERFSSQIQVGGPMAVLTLAGASQSQKTKQGR